VIFSKVNVREDRITREVLETSRESDGTVLVNEGFERGRRIRVDCCWYLIHAMQVGGEGDDIVIPATVEMLKTRTSSTNNRLFFIYLFSFK